MSRGRLRGWLAGDDGPDRDALPIGELLHPVALFAVATLAINDHLLKGVGPGWLTGKLSDVAGLVFAPLLLAALVDLALAAAVPLGLDVDPSLGPRKLAGALALVGLGFVAVELWPPATRGYLAAVGALGFPSVATADPTDLAALPALLVAAWIGRGEIARVPLGRLAVVARRCDGDPARAAASLADVRAVARDPTALDALAAAVAAHGAAPTDATRAAVAAALARLRGRRQRKVRGRRCGAGARTRAR